MAKKRKKEKKEEQEYEFTPPEFNEREFLEKELKDTRVAIITVGLAVLFGVAAGVLTALQPSIVVLGLIVGVAGALSLKYLYDILGLDISHFTKKNWAGTLVTYFFVFLAIWVLLINTPFADLTSPSVDEAVIWVSDGENVTGITYREMESTGSLAWLRNDNNESADGFIHTTSSYTINITARIADTGGIASAGIALGSSSSPYNLMTKGSSGKYEYSFSGSVLAGDSVLRFYILAQDKHGHETLFAPATIQLAA